MAACAWLTKCTLQRTRSVSCSCAAAARSIHTRPVRACWPRSSAPNSTPRLRNSVTRSAQYTIGQSATGSQFDKQFARLASACKLGLSSISHIRQMHHSSAACRGFVGESTAGASAYYANDFSWEELRDDPGAAGTQPAHLSQSDFAASTVNSCQESPQKAAEDSVH